MGLCYSQQQQWDAYKQSRRQRYRRHRHNKTASVIYEQKSIYESSFASNVYSSFREELHHTISSIAAQGGQVVLGSLAQMSGQELQVLYRSLHKINSDGEKHILSDPIILCNLKTKNYLHTHKIKHPDCKLHNQISCCPYTSNHIPEYDIWKFIQLQPQNRPDPSSQKLENGDEVVRVYIFHPFTQRFLNFEKGCIMGGQTKQIWQVQSFGPRRNGGFVRIALEDSRGELCMSEQKGLLDKHRKAELCQQKHISHVWELNFVDSEDMSNMI